MSAANTLVLDAGLFGDAETLRAAVDAMPASNSVTIKADEMKPEDWDDVLGQILASDKIIVI